MTSGASTRTITNCPWKQRLTALYPLEKPSGIGNAGHEVAHHRGEGATDPNELPERALDALFSLAGGAVARCLARFVRAPLTAHQGPSNCRF